MALVAFENLSFRYPDASAPVLDSVSQDVAAGSFTLVMGPTGCGKTTLLRLLKSALAPHGIRTGRVLFDGRPLDEVPEREQVARIGFVMQSPEAQIVTDKVWHELAFGLENLGCDQATMRRRVAEMASYFGIQHWFHRNTAELSGGQKQLLNLASVMVMQPDVLVLDEPTSQLDPLAASNFLGTVAKINRDLGVTVVMTEHRLEEAYALADTVVALESGQVMAAGTPREVAQRLFEADNPMAAALPSPARIYYGVEYPASGATGARAAGAAAAGTEGAESAARAAARAMPLTVREGRAWLAGEVKDPLPAAMAPAPCFPDELAVRIRDVWFRYGRDGDDVLRGTTLEVPRGSLFALVGGNGTGKSTLLRVVCGSLRPYRGKVAVLGKPLGAWRPGELFKGGAALLPQDPLSLMAKSTVRADLEEMLEGRFASAAAAARAFDDVVEKTEVASLLEAHPYDLSGGELQRAALAKVLLCRPRLLLLDEPTSGLDALHKQRLAHTLATLTAEGVTVLMVSHDVEFCAAHADLAALFFDGGVASSGPARPFFAGNSFYTTAANRMSRGILEGAVTDEDVITRCRP